MGSKTNLIRICAVALWIVAIPAALVAQTLTKGTEYLQLVPTKTGNHIPVGESGTNGVGVLKLQLTCSGGPAYIGQITVSRNDPTDTLLFDFVTTIAPFNVRAFLNTNNKYNTNPSSNNPELIVTGVSKPNSTDIVITIDPTDANAAVPNGTDSRNLWIAFNYPNSLFTKPQKNVSYYIKEVRYGPTGNRTASGLDPSGDPTEAAPINNYRVSFDAQGIVVNAEETQGTTDIPVLRLEFSGGATDEAVMKQLATIRLEYLGERAADVPAGGVTLYVDSNGNGSYDSATDLAVSSTSVVAGTPATATFPPAATLPAIPEVRFSDSKKYYFVLVNVATTAVVGNTVGFQVTTPSSHITFTDVEGDNGANISGEYLQSGYITASGPLPAGGNSFTVSPLYVPSPPYVTSVVPGDGQGEVALNANAVVKFSEDVQIGTIIPSNFFMFEDADTDGEYDVGTDTIVPGTASLGGDLETATFDPTSDLGWGTQYGIYISTGVKDMQDDLGMSVPWVSTFVTKLRIDPTVLSRSPVNGATEVERDASITATFSKAMDATTIDDADPTVDPSNFIVFIDANTNGVYDGGDTIVNGTVLYNAGNRTATFDPSTDLAWTTTYTVILKTGIEDTEGLPLPAEVKWTFTTVIAIYPSVLTASPGANKTSVARSSSVAVTFNKDLDPTTIVDADTLVLPSNFIVYIDANDNGVYDGGDTMVSGAVAYDAGTHTATFTHGLVFDYETEYRVTIVSGASGVKSTDGLAMQPPDETWTFTTVDFVNPKVVNTDPAPNMPNIMPGASIRATFSKDMDPATVESPATSFKVFRDVNANGAYDAGTDTLVAGTVTYDSGTTTATFDPTADLAIGVTYTASVSTDAEDVEGLPLASEKVWTFDVVVRPAVLSVSPAAGSVGVPRGSLVRIVFSKDMDPGTLIENDTVTLRDGFNARVPLEAGTGFRFDPASYTLTLDPVGLLPYGSFTVTVKGGASGVKDTFGIEMSGDVAWTFATMPDLVEPVAASNRIQPGVNDRTLIFIPEPPASAGGADAPVTVQVFTATGKRVATLANAERYSDLSDRLPIEWFGENSRGEDLGPGLYFVRISAPGWVRTLKVMVVR